MQIELVLESYQKLKEELNHLSFVQPVTHVYNTLDYAWQPFENYLRTYARKECKIFFLGINPGPWGMAQTGIPFGDVRMVCDWLQISGKVGKPHLEHPKKKVEGFACKRSEVSGSRLWSWCQERFVTPVSFFQTCFVMNDCPLLFLEESGKNRTPNQLPKDTQNNLLSLCDEAVLTLLRYLEPEVLVGVGNFAFSRVNHLSKSLCNLPTTKILHPSPASPRTNQGWSSIIEKELFEAGLQSFFEFDLKRE